MGFFQSTIQRPVAPVTSETALPAATADILALPGLPLVPPKGSLWAGRGYPVGIGTIPGATVRPEEGVHIHDGGVIKILARVPLREKLKLKDGDRTRMTVRLGTDLCRDPAR